MILSILLAWFIAAVLHLAIGSVSVAAITAAGIIAPILDSLDVSPVVIGLAIASGAMFALQVNSNFFWMFKALLGPLDQGHAQDPDPGHLDRLPGLAADGRGGLPDRLTDRPLREGRRRRRRSRNAGGLPAGWAPVSQTIERTAPQPATSPPGSPRLVIGLLLASAFVVILNETLMSVAIPELTGPGVTAARPSGCRRAFMLTMAVVIPVTGFLLQRSTSARCS